jgi:hypothetical protein
MKMATVAQVNASLLKVGAPYSALEKVACANSASDPKEFDMLFRAATELSAQAQWLVRDIMNLQTVQTRAES